MRNAVRALVVLLLLAASQAPATAQQGSPVLLTDLDADYAPRVVVGDEPVVMRWSAYNLHRQSPFFVTVVAPGVRGWTPEIEPNRFFLQPLEERNLTVRLVPGERVPERAEFVVVFSFLNSDTGQVTNEERRVVIVATQSARVLDVFPNPLPPPLDNVYGVFVLNLTFWILFAVAAMVLGDTVVRIVAARAPSDTVRLMMRKLRKPVFLLVFAVGVWRSFQMLPPSRGVEFALATLEIVVVVTAAYVTYQVLSAILDYYAATFAHRTESKIDDVLVPVFRKIGAVVVFVVAAGMVFQRVGLNPAVLFGAAGIVGLVIAFAAQDTLSNFFSGIFLLLDRPFSEGDDIQLETGEVTRVENIGLRSTRLYHYRNHEIFVLPNNQLSTRRIVNLTKPDRRYRVRVEVGVHYDTDVRKVRGILERVARAHPDVLIDQENVLVVFFDSFGDSALNFFVLFWVRDLADRWRVAQEVREQILEAFRAEGIQIPFPHRTLVFPEGGPPAR